MTNMSYYEYLDYLRKANTEDADITIDMEPASMDSVTAGKIKSAVAQAVITYYKQLDYVYIDEYTMDELKAFRKEVDRVRDTSLASHLEIRCDKLPRIMAKDLKDTIQLILIRRCNDLWFNITRST